MTGFVPLGSGRAWRPLGGADGAPRAGADAGQPWSPLRPAGHVAEVGLAGARGEDGLAGARGEDGRAGARGEDGEGPAAARPSAAPAPEAAFEARVAEAVATLDRARAAEHATREAVRAAEHAAALAALAEATTAAEAAATAHDAASARETAAAARLDQAATALLASRRAALDEVRDHAAALVLEGARRIAGEALHADPALLDALVHEAVEALGRAGLTVRAAPEDVPGLRERWDGLEVVADATVAAGCVCVGPAGQVDASLGVAVAALRTVLDTWKAS